MPFGTDPIPEKLDIEDELLYLALASAYELLAEEEEEGVYVPLGALLRREDSEW